MALLSKEDQEVLAEKIKMLITLVGLLTPDEIETLEKMRENLKNDISKLQAIGGLLVDIDESDNKIAHYNAMIKRTDAVIAIHESNVEMNDADLNLASRKENAKAINALFNL